MAEVGVQALGPLRAVVDGAAVDLGGPRQRAVLARLVAAGGHVVSTDRIIDDLWAGEPPPKALAALQVHVSNLRRVLEPGRVRRTPATVLVSVAPGYALSLPVEDVDVWRFEKRLRDAESSADPATLSRALGQALDDWHGGAFAEFADTAWGAPEAARLEELRLVAVEQRAGADLALGHAARLVPALERHLHDHPLREEAVRLLTLALYRTGRQGDALATLRSARDHLADQLGVDPGPGLRALESAVLAQSPDLDLPTPSSPPASGPGSAGPGLLGAGGQAIAAAAVTGAPVVPMEAQSPPTTGFPPRTGVTAVDATAARVQGREGELARIATAARTAAAEGARLVWVSGEAGAGKTTLAEVAAEQLGAQGWRVAWGRCPEVDGAPPAWAWSEVLSSLGETAATGSDTAFQLARLVGDELVAAAGRTPLLVVVDDAHRADSATLQILRQVLLEVARRPVLVLATFRASEAGPDLGVTSAVLAGVTGDRLDVVGLDRAGVAGLAREAGLEVTDDVLDTLAERTGGNPLFVRELARLMAAEGPVAARHAVPTGVREVLRRRVARLPEIAHTVLRHAAVLGRTVDVDVLTEVWGRDVDDLLDALEAAVLAGLLAEPAPGQVRFTHALIRDTLYEDTPLLRRRHVHAAALAVLERRSPDDAAALAHHALAAATPATAYVALRHAVEAAERMLAISNHVEAAQLFAEAIRMHELSGSDDDERLIGLLVPLVGAQAHTSVASQVARRTRDRALALALGLGRDDLVARAVTSWRAPVTWSLRDVSVRVSGDVTVADQARRLLTTDVDDATAAWLGFTLTFELEDRDVPGAIAASGEALAAARRSGDPAALCAALNARTYMSLGPDIHDERPALVRELVDVASSAGLLGYQALAQYHLFLEAADRADLALAQRQVDVALERSTSGQVGQILGVLAFFRAATETLAGRYDAAEAIYTEISRRHTAAETANVSAMQLVGSLAVGFGRGDLAGMLPAIRELNRVMPGTFPEGLMAALLDAGEVEAAREVLLTSPPTTRDYFWLGLSALRARTAARLGERAQAEILYADLLPRAGAVAGLDAGSISLGPVDHVLADLATVLDRADDAARHRADGDALLAKLRAELGA